MRKLASIKKILKVDNIIGKDRIGLARVDGWQVIVQKDEMHEGDLVVFCEIDSVLPDKPEFEFLKKGKGLRIKTLKISGAISQGICFPLSILPEGNYEEGMDVTEILGVAKWEPNDVTDYEPKHMEKQKIKKYPKFLMKQNWFRQLVYKKDHRGSKAFPDFISKTDEVRVQNAPFYLESKDLWTFTEKVDGTSGTFAMVKTPKKWFFGKDKFDYIVCSRNLRLYNKDNSVYWRVSDRYGIEKVLKQLIYMFGVDWVAIQGECIAPGVQGNKYKISEPDLYVFNLITPDGRWDSVSGKEIIENFGMKWVPIVEKGALLPKTVEEMFELAHGKSAIGDTLREGLVCRTLDGKQSFKAVDPEFLMIYDE